MYILMYLKKKKKRQWNILFRHVLNDIMTTSATSHSQCSHSRSISTPLLFELQFHFKLPNKAGSSVSLPGISIPRSYQL